MKRVLFFLLSFIALNSQAQYSEHSVSLKLGAGYAQDFPGLGGYGILGELFIPMTDRLEAAIGAKRMNMKGYPRSKDVQEYTLATTIDFNIFYLPVNTESHIVRLGGGYAFSFYNIRRSYPVITTTGTEKQTDWPVRDNKGRSSGISVIGEYEYLLENSNISLGLRAAWYKAYDRVSYIGPFVGIRF